LPRLASPQGPPRATLGARKRQHACHPGVPKNDAWFQRGSLDMTDLASASTSLRNAIASASRGLVERESLVELVALSAVAGEHLLVVGPPGTAKSEAVRRVARALGGRYFEYIVGGFTE